MRLENLNKPHRRAAAPYPETDASSAETNTDRRMLTRALIAMVSGCPSAKLFADYLGIGRVDASRLIEMVLEYLENADFAVEGRGVQLARIDIAGNRILLPLVLGPVSDKVRAAAMAAFEVNRMAWDARLADLGPAGL